MLLIWILNSKPEMSQFVPCPIDPLSWPEIVRSESRVVSTDPSIWSVPVRT
jgi:hypothetical protein